MASSAPGFAESLERKLNGLSNTMESIQGLSHWIIDHKSRSVKIVERWLKSVKKSPCEQRLNLFYLANDVVQNCKRKDAIVFRDAFSEVLPEATSLVRDLSVRKPIERIFGIWEQREIFKKDFTVRLREILVNAKAKVAESPNVAEFRPDSIIQQLTAFKKLEDDLMKKETQAANLHVEFLSLEDFKLIKDQEGGMLFSNELEETSAKLEDFIVHLEKDIKRSPVIIEALGKAELFYEAQFKDVKIVVNAYTNFGSRVVHLKRRLEELIAELPGLSPMMSPQAGIPSPAGSDSPMAGPEGSPFSPPMEDIDLPDDDVEDTVTSGAPDTSSTKAVSGTVTVQSTISARAMKLGNRQLHANKTSTIPSLPDLDLRKLSGVIGSFTGLSSLLQTDAGNTDVQDSASASPPAESFEGSDSETLSPSMPAAVGVSSSHSIKTRKMKSPSAKSLRSSTDSCGDDFARHQCFSPTAEKQSTGDLETITAPESSSSSSLESRIHSMLKDNPSFLPFSLGSPVRAADENPYNVEESAPSRTAFEGSSSPVSATTFEKPRVRRASMASNKSTSSIPSLTVMKETPIPSIASDRPSPIPSLAQNRTKPKYPVTPEEPAHIPTLMGIGRTEKQDEENMFANERGSGTPTQDEPSDLTGFSQTGDATYSTFPQYAMTGYPLSNHMAFQSSQEPLQGFYSVEEERTPASRTAARKMSSNLLVLSNSCSNEDDNESTNDTRYSSKLGASVGNTDDFQFNTVAGAKSASVAGISSDVHSSWGYGASAGTNQNQSQMAMKDIMTTSPYSHFGYSDRPPVQSPTSQPPFHSNLASEIHHYMMSHHLNHTNPLFPPNTAVFERGPFALSKPLPHQMAASPHQIVPPHPTLMPLPPHLGPVLAPSAHQVPLSPSQAILPSHPHLILQQPRPVRTPTSRSVQTPPFRTVSSQSPVQHPSLPPGYVVAPHLLPTPSPKRPHFTPNLPTTGSTQAHSSKTPSIKQRASSHPTPQPPSSSVPHSKLHFPNTQKLPLHHSRSKHSGVREKVHTTVQKPQKEDPKDGLEKNEGTDKTPSSSSNSDKNVQSNKHQSPTQEIDANQSQAESVSGNSKEEKKEPPQNQPDPDKKGDDTLGNTASSSGTDKPQVPMPQENYSKPYHKDGGFPNKILANHVSPSTVDFPPQPRPLGGHQYQGRGDFRPRALLANPRIPFDGGIKRPGPPFAARPSLPKRPFMAPPRY